MAGIVGVVVLMMDSSGLCLILVIFCWTVCICIFSGFEFYDICVVLYLYCFRIMGSGTLFCFLGFFWVVGSYGVLGFLRFFSQDDHLGFFI